MGSPVIDALLKKALPRASVSLHDMTKGSTNTNASLYTSDLTALYHHFAHMKANESPENVSNIQRMALVGMVNIISSIGFFFLLL